LQVDPSKIKAKELVPIALFPVSMMSYEIGYNMTFYCLADSYLKSNSDNARIHSPILPFKIGMDSICLMTSKLDTTVHSEDKK
jgi:hypothetical protein